MKEWEELLKTLQSFSKKMESNAIKKGTGKIVRGFVCSENSIKALVAEAKRELGERDSSDLYVEFNNHCVLM